MTRLDYIREILESMGYNHKGMYVEIGNFGNYWGESDTRQAFAIDEKGKLKYVDDWWLEEYDNNQC